MSAIITTAELKCIRKEVIKVQHQPYPGNTIYVVLVLPDHYDRETLDYACHLRYRLQQVELSASISEVQSFSCETVSERRFEVMKDQPTGLPCIRIYPKYKAVAKSNDWKGSVKRRLTRLFMT